MSACVHTHRWLDVNEVVRRTSLFNLGVKRTFQEIKPRDLISLRNEIELEETDETLTIEGTRVKKYIEKYKGVPVYDAFATFETDESTDEYTGQASGHVVDYDEDDVISIEPHLSMVDSIITAKLDIQIKENHDRMTFEAEESILKIYAFGSQSHLVYEVTLVVHYADHTDRPAFFVDANNGTIIKRWSKKRSSGTKGIKANGGNPARGELKYGHTMPFLNVKQLSEGLCRLENANIRVFHLQNMDERSKGMEPYTFICADGIHDPSNEGYSPLSDAYFFANKVFEMFTVYTGNPPIAKNNLPFDILVHYGQDKLAATYYGTFAVFSDGVPKVVYPFTTIDIVGHELSHGFTEIHSNLEYRGQSGTCIKLTIQGSVRYVYQT